MKIYSKERSVAHLIEKNAKAYLVLPMKTKELDIDLFLDNLKNIQENGCVANLSEPLSKLVANTHPDLMSGSAILVSTVMNRNDDIFLAEETWKARNTPINTPFNDSHQETNIIGHIFAARVLSEDGTVYSGDDIPEYFDIEVDFVIYSTIYPELSEDIKNKAASNEKFVSMEAYMDNFDYALYSEEDKKLNIVARNEETSFLTKYLRIYGGSGKYDNKRIGRVLRDFRFSGMGNVDTPANPKSLYTRIESAEILNFIEKSTKGNVMFETLEDALAHIKKLDAELEDVKSAKVNAQLEESNSRVIELESEVEAEKNKVSVAQTKLTEANESVESLKAELEQAKNDLKVKSDELDKIKADEKLEARINALSELGIKVADEKKESIAKMSDDSFNSLVEFTKELAPKANAEPDPKDEAEDVIASAEENKDDDVVDGASAAGSDNGQDQVKAVASKLVDVLSKRRERTHKLVKNS